MMPDFLKKIAEWYWEIPAPSSNIDSTWTFKSTGLLHFLHGGLWVLLFVVTIVLIALDLRSTFKPPIRFFSLPLLRRSLIALLLLLVFSGLTLQIDESQKPTQALVLDISKSMSVSDQLATSQSSRFQQIQEVLTRNDGELLKKWSRDSLLNLYLLSDHLHPLGTLIDVEQHSKMTDQIIKLTPSGSNTAFRTSLNQLLKTERSNGLKSILLISDGISTGEEQESLSRFVAQDLPEEIQLSTLGVGSSEPPLDLQILSCAAPAVSYRGEPVEVQLRLHSTQGSFPAINVSVKNTHGSSSPLLTKDYADSPGESKEIKFLFTPKETGIQQYEVTISTLETAEIYTENNHQLLNLLVTDTPLRVLLADSKPRYEFRALKNLLQRNNSFQLTTFLQSADLLYASSEKSSVAEFPDTKEAYAKYDVLILGDLTIDQLNLKNAELLTEWVSSGEILIWIAGSEFGKSTAITSLAASSLAPLLPIDFTSTTEGSWSPSPLTTVPAPLAERQFPFLSLQETSQAPHDRYYSFPPFSGHYSGYHFKETAQPFLIEQSRPMNPLTVFQRFGQGGCLFHAVDETWRWRYRQGDSDYGDFWIQTLRGLTALLRSELPRNNLPAPSSAEMQFLASDLSELQQAAAASGGYYLPLTQAEQYQPPSESLKPLKGNQLKTISLWNSVELFILLVFLLIWEWRSVKFSHTTN